MRIYEKLDPVKFGSELAKDVNWSYNAKIDKTSTVTDQFDTQKQLILRSVTKQQRKIAKDQAKRSRALMQKTTALTGHLQTPQHFMAAWQEYLIDAAQRFALTMDVLRERGDIFLEHEAAGCPPVLIYDYDIVVDGMSLDRPCNYQLLRINPPKGVDVDPTTRPYIIIDPRAGHGGGIGGFKQDSQVGVALAKGHPVYFVSFGRDPAPGQNLADVMHAEAEFVRTVRKHHPDSPQPVVIGNCQGGWATLVLGACNPEITGPIVLNGAPVSPWSGTVGENPMRYNAGVLGGTWQPMFWSDLGDGKFDGANLVMNFELLNPSRNYFGKYFDLFSDPTHTRQRFIDFERWWGGFFILNEEEIHWIVEQLFVGNRLVKNTAQLEPGVPLDIKAIKAPIFVFASHGDNITPPQQALNWITETYADEQEIRLRGQRIIYMLHEDVGHLGIFVSSKVARTEHTEMASTLETVEAMAPGLYEMQIEDSAGNGIDKQFKVRIVERTLADLAALDDGQHDEVSFAAVSHLSEVQAGVYQTFGRPMVQSIATPASAKIMRDLHPLRLQRAVMSSGSPAMAYVPKIATAVQDQRTPATEDNPFLQMEKLTASWIEQAIDFNRDMRDAWYEATFYFLWGGPLATWFGQKNAKHRTLPNKDNLRNLPEVKMALSHMSEGGAGEAIVRMLVLLADSHSSFRAEMLDRWAHVFATQEPFIGLDADQRQRLIHEQTVIATFDPEGAVATLPKLLPSNTERKQVAELVINILGTIENSSPELEAMAQDLCHALNITKDGRVFKQANSNAKTSTAQKAPAKRKI